MEGVGVCVGGGSIVDAKVLMQMRLAMFNSSWDLSLLFTFIHIGTLFLSS